MTPTPAGAARATRLAFLAAGFGMAAWAPLVPHAKARIGADDAVLGLVLLCLGIGSLLAMPTTGWIGARRGSRPMILAGGVALALLLPCLTLGTSAVGLAVALLGFGAALGTLDVAMNIHAVEVEHGADRPLMSGFHAMFSLGGFAGSGATTALLALGAPPTTAALAAAGVVAAAILLARPDLLSPRGEPTPFVAPHGIVLVLALLGAVTFLVEGALLDWSALLLVDRGLADTARAGFGYMIFSIAMTIGRLTGDRIVARWGDRRVMIGGGLATVAGFAVLLAASHAAVAALGLVAIGLGAANVVPVLFRLAGRQKVMPVGLAVAALTTTGYAGILAGPAAIGFLAQAIGLPAAFWLLAGLMALVPLLAGRVTR